MTDETTPVSPEEPVTNQMVFPLRFGERIGWAWRFSLSSFGYVLGLYLIYMVLGVTLGVITLVLVASTASISFDSLFHSYTQAPDPAQLMALTGPTTVLIILGMMIPGMLIMSAYSASFYRLPVLYLEGGKRPSYLELLRDAWSRTPDLVNTMGAVMLLPLLIGGVGYGVLFAGHRLTPMTGGVMGFLTIAMTLVIMIGLALVGPVASNEPVSFWIAIRRAWALSQGRRWSLFGYMLVVPLLFALLGIAINLLDMFLVAILPPSGVLVALAGLTTGLIALALQVVATTMLLVGLTVYYLESRIFREGWVPAWRGELKVGWPRNGPPAPPLTLRGKKGWRDFILLNGAVLGGIWWLYAAFGDRFPASTTRISFGGTTLTQHGDAPPVVTRHDMTPIKTSEPVAGVTGKTQIELEIGSFFDMGQKATLWVKPHVLMPNRPWPEAIKPKGLVRIEITSVRSKDGQEWYDANAGTETPFFWDITLNEAGDGRYDGIRQVSLRAGAKKEGIDTVQGILHWRAPTSVTEQHITPAQVGSQLTIAGRSVTIKALDDRTLRLDGPVGYKKAIVGVLGRTADGTMIETNSVSSSNGLIVYGFTKAIDQVVLYVGGGYQQADKPFTLRPGQTQTLTMGESNGASSEGELFPSMGASTGTAAVPAEPEVPALDHPVAPAATDSTPVFNMDSVLGRQKARQWLYRKVQDGYCAEALPVLNRLLLREGGDAWAHYARGACQVAMGNKRAAEDDVVYACGHGYPKACDLLSQ